MNTSMMKKSRKSYAEVPRAGPPSAGPPPAADVDPAMAAAMAEFPQWDSDNPRLL